MTVSAAEGHAHPDSSRNVLLGGIWPVKFVHPITRKSSPEE
jgi:hypothetical protein